MEPARGGSDVFACARAGFGLKTGVGPSDQRLGVERERRRIRPRANAPKPRNAPKRIGAGSIEHEHDPSLFVGGGGSSSSLVHDPVEPPAPLAPPVPGFPDEPLLDAPLPLEELDEPLLLPHTPAHADAHGPQTQSTNWFQMPAPVGCCAAH